MSRTKKNFANRRREIAAIAEQLFLEKGYEDTSITDILEAAGLSKGGFYHYFGTKEEIILECIQHIAEELSALAEEILSGEQLDAIDKCFTFMSIRDDILQGKQEIIGIMKVVSMHEVYQNKLIELLVDTFSGPYAHLIEQGNREGLFQSAFPMETARLIMRLIIPGALKEPSSNRDMVQNEEKALNHLIIRTLGITQLDRLRHGGVHV
ncbi:TetR/AcrR family transcriptional regulator [Paenibacillus paeoniae]|uniref:TetR/AcrR family transcriptional regulator n=1 Tax=Paenibacillus paeoniae TaxID=2292705 RepID=A0A371PJT4_9BACL|nr:TetR/AcrR family transcriptional regulator [Paenibacillus paeoniae]REK76424.1 TetR/AcrR family transcriptional regulator [Paenibacillus paeoniae]